MKNIKKIAIFTLVMLLLCSAFSLTALAAGEEGVTSADAGAVTEPAGGKLDMNLKPESLGERFEYALQGTVTGMVMVFAVLALLTIILYISKYFLYDLPRKDSPEEKAEKEARAKRAKEAAEAKEAEKAKKAEEKAEKSAVPAPVAPAQDDAQLAAVITAAIAAMIESGDYKNEFVGGFRVVSFKRSAKTAWNRK